MVFILLAPLNNTLLYWSQYNIDMKYTKKLTVNQWKKFNKIESGELIGNDVKFFNFFTQRYESYDYITRQEMLLAKYKITLSDHQTKKYVKVRYPNDRIRIIKIDVVCPIPLKEKLKGIIKNIPSKITVQNINQGIKTSNSFISKVDKTMNQLSKEMNQNKRQKRNKVKHRKSENQIQFF